ncbi:MAG: hypothetical protein ACTHNZ_13120 [Trinickia sp.]|uniref:hypothetical protein n=1 Tax=Trinickia sp. TaxID=2571163 RepID=UPI003F7ED511
MSYDLLFTLPADVTKDDIEAYFQQRRHYRVDGGATYENFDTGVYFSFAVDQGETSVEQGTGADESRSRLAPL